MKQMVLMMACTCALFFAIISFSGCEVQSVDRDDSIPYEQKSDRNFEMNTSYQWFKGHRYVYFHSGHGHGIAHDPDCPRCEEKTKQMSDIHQQTETGYDYEEYTPTLY